MNLCEDECYINDEKLDIYEINPLNTPMDLLLLADPSLKSINTYIKNSRVIVARKKLSIIGIIVFVKRTQDTYEIVNLAVEERCQHKGVAKNLLKAVDLKMKPLGANKLSISTGNSSLRELGLYQRFGFRLKSIEQDYYLNNYKEEIWENGILCRDKIVLDKEY